MKEKGERVRRERKRRDKDRGLYLDKEYPGASKKSDMSWVGRHSRT